MSLSRVYGVILRHVFLATHQIERIFDAFFLPIISLVLFGFLANYMSVLQSPNFASFLKYGIMRTEIKLNRLK